MMARLFLPLVILLTQFTGTSGLWAQSPGGELSLPWQSFERLLKLNNNDITLTWEDFQRLIKQTGVTKLPPYNIRDGKVVLTRTEFKNLLNRMKPPAGETPKYFLTQARYIGRIGKKSTRITGTLLIQIPSETPKIQPIRIRLFPGNMALEELLLDGKPALVENDGSGIFLTITTPGKHTITTRFSAPANLEKPPHTLSFSIPRTPITQLTLTLPLRNVDVKVDNAAYTDVIRKGNLTEVRASLPAGQSIRATWNPVTPEKKKGPARVYATVHNLLSIEEDALRVRARIELEVLQNTINVLNVKIPAGYNLLDVQGDAVGEWKVRGKDKKVLIIPMRYARKGKFILTILAEQVLKEKSQLVAFEGFQVLKSVRERGFVGVELKTTAEAKVVDLKGLERRDIQELPRMLIQLSQRPLLFGFKYLRQPYHLNLDIQRHEEVAVLSTVVDQANGVTLVLEDGKRIHQVTYAVRNTWKQFLQLELPKGAQVWSAFVDQQRVKPSRNLKGKLLIPLNRSKASSGGRLSSFDVEVMYYQGSDGLGLGGIQEIPFPVPDVVVSQMLWSVYLPVRHDYLYFGGDVDNEERAEGFTPLIAAVRGNKNVFRDLSASNLQGLYSSNAPVTEDVKKQRLYQAKNTRQWSQRGKFSKSRAVGDDAYARQVEREINFFNRMQQQAVEHAQGGGGGVAGTLPIRVQVPNTGEVFRFTKQVLVDAKSLKLRVYYANHRLLQFLKLLFLALILTGLYRSKAAWISWGRSRIESLKATATFQWLKTPLGNVVLMLGLTLIFYCISRLLFVLALLAFSGACLRWAWPRLAAWRGMS